MIMYDMIRNHKEVNADNIIKRQIALANYKESTEDSFYSDERMNFLQKFYEYCQKSGDSFNVKWSEWKKSSDASSTAAFSASPTLGNTSSFIKNSITPTSLYVVSQDSMTASERTMVTTLQGVVNNHCSSQIYTLNSSQPDYKIWLEDLKDNYGVSYKILSDPWELLSIYKDYIDGYVLYSKKAPKDPSINNACSLASLNKNVEEVVRKLEQNPKIKVVTPEIFMRLIEDNVKH